MEYSHVGLIVQLNPSVAGAVFEATFARTVADGNALHNRHGLLDNVFGKVVGHARKNNRHNLVLARESRTGLILQDLLTLLISILLPSLRTARRQAKRVTCATNQRELLVGTRMYADEHHNVMPRPNWGWPSTDRTLPRGWLYDPPRLGGRGRNVRWDSGDLQTGQVFTYA